MVEALRVEAEAIQKLPLPLIPYGSQVLRDNTLLKKN